MLNRAALLLGFVARRQPTSKLLVAGSNPAGVAIRSELQLGGFRASLDMAATWGAFVEPSPGTMTETPRSKGFGATSGQTGQPFRGRSG